MASSPPAGLVRLGAGGADGASFLMPMVRFASPRERHLWGWALAVLTAIYSTAWLAGRLAEILRGRGLLGAAFATAFVLVIAAVIGVALQRRPRANEMWVAIGVAAVYGMVIVRMAIDPIERTHLFEFGLLAVLIHEALLERRRHDPGIPVPAVLAVVITAALGWVDEGIQALLPSRMYDLRDVGLNALAGLLATVASGGLAWARRRDALGGRHE